MAPGGSGWRAAAGACTWPLAMGCLRRPGSCGTGAPGLTRRAARPGGMGRDGTGGDLHLAKRWGRWARYHPPARAAAATRLARRGTRQGRTR